METISEVNSVNQSIEILESETIYDENCVAMGEVIFDKNYVTIAVEPHVTETMYGELGFEQSTVENKEISVASCENSLVETNFVLESIPPSPKTKIPKNICEYCNKKFTNSSNCAKHLANVHKVQRQITKTDIICIECKIPYKRVSQLREHLSQQHKLEMGEEEFRFPNINEFKRWKCEEERRSLCTYVMKQGIKKSKDGARYFYVCHRSGKHVTKVTNRKRNMRTQGTCKLGMSCTSAITVFDSGREVIAKYCKHHYGHGGMTTLIKISPQEQNAIAATVEKGVSFRNVLEEIRGSFTEKDHFQYHILQKKDFQRIKKALATEGPNLEMSDVDSLDLWVQTCCQMENSPVLLYRPESYSNEEKGSDSGFALIIMTEYQKHILLASAKKIVCVDRTHRRKGSRYYVTVLFVMDEYDLGFPTAFCVSSKVDKTMMLQFFDAVKQTTGYLETDYFMSDGEEYFYDAWKEVMNNDPKWLWNTWFVDVFWRGQLRIFKGNIERRGEVYNNMRSLLECQSDSVFKSMLDTFIKSLTDDNETKDLAKYLEQHYAPTASMWAYCYRKDLGIGTSIQLEILHRTMRFCTREGFKQRLDKYIFVLMKLVRDKILDRLSKIETDKLTLALANIGWCHKTGLEIPTTNVIPFSDKEWDVKSVISDDKFHITLDNQSCPEHCSLVCEDCDICVHMFTCTCYDNLINANLCEHIHAVAVTCLVPKFVPPQSPTNMENSVEDEDEDSIDDEHIPNSSDEFLLRTLKRTHVLYKKIRSSKCNLSNYALQKIFENLNECMDICDGKIASGKPECENSEIKNISNITVLSPINNIKSSNAIAGLYPSSTAVSFPRTVCAPVTTFESTKSFVQKGVPLYVMTKKKASLKKKRKSKKEFAKSVKHCKIQSSGTTTNAKLLQVDAPILSTLTNSGNITGSFIPINSLTNLGTISELGTPIKVLIPVTTMGMNKSVNTLTNVNTVGGTDAFANLNSVFALSSPVSTPSNVKTHIGTAAPSNKLNTVFAIVTSVNTLTNVSTVDIRGASTNLKSVFTLTNPTNVNTVSATRASTNLKSVVPMTIPTNVNTVTVTEAPANLKSLFALTNCTNVNTVAATELSTNLKSVFTLTSPTNVCSFTETEASTNPKSVVPLTTPTNASLKSPNNVDIVSATDSGNSKFSNAVFALITPISATSTTKSGARPYVPSNAVKVKTTLATNSPLNMLNVPGVGRPTNALTILKSTTGNNSPVNLIPSVGTLGEKSIKVLTLKGINRPTVLEKSAPGSSTTVNATARKTFTVKKRTLAKQDSTKQTVQIANENKLNPVSAQNAVTSMPYILLLTGK